PASTDQAGDGRLDGLRQFLGTGKRQSRRMRTASVVPWLKCVSISTHPQRPLTLLMRPHLSIGQKVVVPSTGLTGEVYQPPTVGSVGLRFFAGPGREWFQTVSIEDLRPAPLASQRRAWVVLDPGGPKELAQFIRLVAEVGAKRPPLRTFAVRFPKRKEPVLLG